MERKKMPNDLFYQYHQQDQGDEETAVWRRDPSSSFSDWTIKVLQSDSCDSSDEESRHRASVASPQNPQSPNNATTMSSSATNAVESIYHVHKVYLASGPRKSEYFQTLFSLTTATEESLSETTTLVLPESACGAFPQFLDFVYGATSNNTRGTGRGKHSQYDEEEDVYSSLIANGSGCDDDDSDCGDSVDSSNRVVHSDQQLKQAVGLAFLADYLRVPALEAHAKETIASLLTLRTAPILCQEALVYSIDWIVDLCTSLVAMCPRDLLLASDSQAGTMRHNAHTHPALFDAKERSALLVPKAMETMQILPHKKQIELLRKALSNTLGELEQYRKAENDNDDDDDDGYSYEFKT